MTAPLGALAAFLDGLDAARAAATPGPWVQADREWNYVMGGVSEDGSSYLDVAVGREGPADAACIVAQHNALPVLTAMVRAVVALHSPEPNGLGYCDECQRDWPCATVRALTAPLAAEEPS